MISSVITLIVLVLGTLAAMSYVYARCMDEVRSLSNMAGEDDNEQDW